MSDQYTSGRLYRRLLTYVSPYKFSFVLSILGFVIYASAAPALAEMMGIIVETLENPTQQMIYLVVGAQVGIFAYRGLGTFLGKYFIARVGRGVIHDLRTALFGHMMKLPSSYYDQESSGRLISRIIFDVQQVMGAATRAITTTVQEGVTVILLMSYLIYLDWTLTLIFLGLIPIIVGLVAVASKYFKKYSKRIQDSMGDVTQITNEALNSTREVRSFGGQQFESDRFLAASSQNLKQGMKYELTNALNVPLNQLIIAIGLGVMVYIMFDRVMSGAMSSAEFMQFITAASLIAKPLRSLSDVNSIIQKGLVGAKSVFEVMDTKSELDDGKEKLADNDTGLVESAQVEIKNLSFKYETSENWILKDINLTAPANKIIALVGQSGSGKTTLMSLLPRFYQFEQGNILINGQDIQSITLESLRKNISIVSQNVTLFNASIKDNIAYGDLAEHTLEEVIEVAKAAHAHDFIMAMPEGYDTVIGDDGVLLSGGQRQRLAIARAILKNAPILILDEATSALDTESERHIQTALETVMQGRTTFVIAHRLSTIENADEIVVMRDGEIQEQGNHAQLISHNGLYSQLHNMQFQD